MIIIISAIAILLAICCFVLWKKDREIVQLNEKQIAENTHLTMIRDDLKKDILIVEESLKNKRDEFNNLYETLNKATENQKLLLQEKIDREYNNYTQELEKEYQEMLDDLMIYARNLDNSISNKKKELLSIEQKQLAYIAEQQRKEQILLEKDYYRLNINNAQKEDIQSLRKIQYNFSKKEVIDKVIWEAYYKPAYDILMSHLFKKNEDKVCGIYKITCLENDKSYIGQSVNIKDRFKQHIKTALSCAPSTNKLYQEMKQYEPFNFIFEVLEIVPKSELNNRELYWINFYKTKEYGLNNTRGNNS